MKINEYFGDKVYPGRIVILGKTPSGEPLAAYAIMGRSENSRNRIFIKENGILKTVPKDESKCTDPSLIIYNAVREFGTKLIVTNGDQTDTICELINKQFTFEQALRTREFEPDEPNYTPRISGIINFHTGYFNYAISIIKTADGNKDSCERFSFAYEAPVAGVGHLIHTYQDEKLTSFIGEPIKFETSDDLEIFANDLWNSLNTDNKISLYVRIGKNDKIINK
ncbi:MAG: IMP cyclohydrolase [Ruminococcus sp.]|jgi:IMP cyclohydrolase|nr:IMP cyclohydrolase [Ruminococcus sp.]